MVRSSEVKLVLTGFLLLLGLAFNPPALAKAPVAEPGIASVAMSELPAPARETYRLIEQGGPFPYEKDGSVFGNRERLLPAEKRGYYKEYTVVTPGVRNRGLQRIVCGGPARMPDVCYYTVDHYASFRRIAR